MNIFHALLLGLVQGLTEFLPISSTAHLTLTAKLFGFIDPQHPETWTAFIAVMQLGSLIAVLLYFSPDIREMTLSVLRDIPRVGGGYSGGTKLALYILAGTLPVAAVGLFMSDLIHGMFTKSTLVIAASLVGLALLLWIAEITARHTRGVADVRLSDALLIGVAQVLALIPGASRSGTTMTAALMLGFQRQAAARFSFLLSIPAIFASGVYEALQIDPSVFQLGVGNLVVATAAAAVSSYAAIAWLLRYLATNTMMAFVWYRIGLGIVLVVLLMLGLIDG